MVAIPSRIGAYFVRPEWVTNWWYFLRCQDVPLSEARGMGLSHHLEKIELDLSCVFDEALQSGLSCSRVLGTACLHYREF